MSRKEALECSAEILETHCIPARYSIGDLPPSGKNRNNRSLAKVNGRKAAQERKRASTHRDGKALDGPLENGTTERVPRKSMKKKFKHRKTANGKSPPNGVSSETVDIMHTETQLVKTSGDLVDLKSTETNPESKLNGKGPAAIGEHAPAGEEKEKVVVASKES